MKGFDDLGTGNETTPEANALYNHVLTPVLNFFTEDTQGQSALKTISTATVEDENGKTAADIVSAAVAGDEKSAELFGEIARALYNNREGTSTVLSDYDRNLLKKYGLYQTDTQKTSMGGIELTFSDLSGKARLVTQRGSGTSNDYYTVSSLEQALAEKKPVSYDGIEYTVESKQHKDDSGPGTYYDYILVDANGNKKTVSTKGGNITLK
jgi:hypothetical protein